MADTLNEQGTHSLALRAGIKWKTGPVPAWLGASLAAGARGDRVGALGLARQATTVAPGSAAMNHPVRRLRLAAAAAALLALALIAGCGQKGDLYLPDDPQSFQA